MVLPLGALINALAIIAGATIGMLCGNRLPEKVRAIVFQGLGLCIMLIGLKMAFKTENELVLIFSILAGGIIGALLCLEENFIVGGNKLKKILGSKNPQFTEGMVSAALLFCIGALAILGSFDEGLRGDRSIIYTKSILDFFASIAMAAALGSGVLFSAFFVFIYQGLLTIFASSLQSVISPEMMLELTATGGILVLGIGLNMLEVVRIPLANMLPALFLAAPFYLLLSLFS